MRLSRFSRRLTATFIAALLLVCQSVAVAQASTAGVPQSSAGEQSATCHDAGRPAGDNRTGDGTCQAQCQHATSSPAKAHAFESVGIEPPLMAVHVDRFAAATDVAPPARTWLARAESPPLQILYCCPRN
jgi:hypothetical protein